MIKIGKNISDFSTHSCQPITKDELKEIIKKRILEQGNECDLNDIDVSLIEDMSNLFMYSNFNGDISEWNVEKVEYMNSMFSNSNFNRDISNWKPKRVRHHMDDMFYKSPLNGREPAWYRE